MEPCGSEPLTGFYRDGCCNTGPEDRGSHTICAVVTREFLDHQRAIGNDLTTPVPIYGFPGLVPGDRWCVTAANWLRAYEDGAAAPVVLASTHEMALELSESERIAVVPGGRQRHHVDVGSSTYGPGDRDEARRIIDEGDGSDQDFQQLREEGVLPSRLPRTMVGATAGLVAFSLGLTVVAGPAFGYTERTAQDLLDRQVYRSAVLSEGSR